MHRQVRSAIGQWCLVAGMSPTVTPCVLLLAHICHLQTFQYEWAWSQPATRCSVRRRSLSEVAAALQSKRLLFAGDSHVRMMHNHLAEALGGEAS